MDDLSHSDKKHSDKKGQSANCDNTNVNLNDINQIQRQNQAVGNTIDTAATLNGESLTGDEALNALTGNGDGTGGLLNLDRNIINICINSNDNTLTGTFTGEQNPQTCEECFEAFLTTDEIDAFLVEEGVQPPTLTEICSIILNPFVTVNEQIFRNILTEIDEGPEPIDQDSLIECLTAKGVNFV
jgi:hypothetical protein